MMRRIWLFLSDFRNLTILGFIAMAALLYLGAELLELALIWAIGALALMALAWLLVWWLRRRNAARAAAGLAEAMAQAPLEPDGTSQAEVDAIRAGMLKAIDTINGSKLGRLAGKGALYELPWYQVFDKGVLDDAEGREIDFRNTIIIATSNLASAAIMQACLNKPLAERPTPAELDQLARPQLMKHFKPAFLGRLQVVPFYPIADEVLVRIIALKLQRIGQRIRASHQAEFSWDDGVVDAVLARCTEVDAGARNVDHILNGTLLPAIADAVLARMGEGVAFASIKVSAGRQGQFKYTIK
jgi:hypothetical protein